MRAAAVQLNSTDDLDRNVERAGRLVERAAAAGAELVALPEKWSLLGDGEVLVERAEPLEGMAIGAARAWAREHGITILAGSVAERLADSEGAPLANTSVLIDPEGAIAATYRKIHMFDVDVGGVAYRESAHEQAGERIVVAGAGPLELGLTVCYDLRFPELYRILALRGATAIAAPSAFTATTGRAHWELLVRARAVENQLFMLAPDQHGSAPPHFESWGHSMIVGPWGRVLACCEEDEGVAVADLDLAELERVRRDMPSLANRRPAAYRWPDLVGTDA
jgi:deaminated glutathione amidase